MVAFETDFQTTVQKVLTSGSLSSSSWIPLSPLEEQPALMVMCHRELPELYSAKLVLSWRLTPSLPSSGRPVLPLSFAFGQQ